jgi:ribonuclease-3
LEFLGDAVLEIVVTEYLYRKFDDQPEGKLTLWRGSLVNTERLAGVAESLELDSFILLSRGEEKTFQPGSTSRRGILANAFEAVLGAIYLDQGIGSCRLLVDSVLHSQLLRTIAEAVDAKTQLQDLTQERFGLTPTYAVVSELGAAHTKTFRMAVQLGDFTLAKGEGASKQQAAFAAAKAALATIIQWERHVMERVPVRSIMRRSRTGDKT